jgi:hypothetical protein
VPETRTNGGGFGCNGGLISGAIKLLSFCQPGGNGNYIIPSFESKKEEEYPGKAKITEN